MSETLTRVKEIASVVDAKPGLFESQIVTEILGDCSLDEGTGDLVEAVEVSQCLKWMVLMGYLRRNYGRYNTTFLTPEIFKENWNIPVDGVMR